jgi:hypothetical protein
LIDVASLQRQLAALIHEGRLESDDPYVQRVAASGRADIVREVIVSWRSLLLRQSAPLTVSLLEERKRFVVTTAEESPFAAELACSFLAGYVKDEDPLVAAAAQFETLMLRHALGHEVDVARAWTELGTTFAATAVLVSS